MWRRKVVNQTAMVWYSVCVCVCVFVSVYARVLVCVLFWILGTPKNSDPISSDEIEDRIYVKKDKYIY